MSSLELGHARARAVLVLLRGATSDAARAFHHAVADDGHRALAGNHVPALGRGDALDDRAPRAFGELAAGPPEGRRRDGFALRAIGAGPDRAVHAIEGHQAPAGI